MKIALLTIWHVRNYGAELQTYCTTKVLQGLGHDVEVIDLRLNDIKKSTTSNFIKKIIAYILDKFNLAYFKDILFWQCHIPSTKQYKSVREIKDNPPKANVYIVGSDQVWNATITKEYAELYFLNFGGDDIVRASYASSFGSDKWFGDEFLTDLANQQLHTFKRVSCRETSGIKLLNNQFGINATHVLDPTLLFKDYKSLIGNIHESKTLVYYPLSVNNETSKFCTDLAKEKGLKLVLANKTIKISDRYLWDRNSIKQWLRAIGSAQFVITPSFHGLTTSIVMHREFMVIITEPLILKRSARVVDLLTQLDLIDRFFTDYETAWNSKIWEKKIDYKAVDEKLSSLREQSFDYLRSIFE